jgi:Na+-translocating ferredoxin:NAD+ oxidoreductase subunit C
MINLIHFTNKLTNTLKNTMSGFGMQHDNADDVYAFNGGIHPPQHKQESNTRPIATMPMPAKLTIPLRQHVGNIPKVSVKIGDYVLKGQILAEAEGMVSAAIHAPTSGHVVAIEDAVIPHPSGLKDQCIVIAPDGKNVWIERKPQDWRVADKAALVASLRLSGIVGLGGATFPTDIKLRTTHRGDKTTGVHTLIINAAECEPYITCDDMLMRERADDIINGILVAEHLLGSTKVVIGIEDNKPEATEAMRTACAQYPHIQVKVVPTLYPSGDARRLVHLLLGSEIPSDKRSTEVGLQVFNVATVMALYRYFEFGEPSLSRIVTMTGNVATPQNFEVLLGTPLNDVVQAAGGAKAQTSHFIMGGPMMGFALPSIEVPLTKASNCIIAASPDLFAPTKPAMPCIRCARCADACPVSLQPQELYWFAKSDNFEKARDYKLFDCIECGCCSYVCPSDIPLVQYYRYAKSEIIASDKAKEAADLARERNEARLARIEREKLERAQKHAERAKGAQAQKAEEKNVSDKLAAKAVSTSSKASKQDLEGIENNKALLQDTVANTSNAPVKVERVTSSSAVSNDAVKDKQAAIAAAIARAKAQKLAAAQSASTIESASKNVTEDDAAMCLPKTVKSDQQSAATYTTVSVKPKTDNATIDTNADKAKADKQALIAAAIARAKAQKEAALAAGNLPKNMDAVSQQVEAEIKAIDAIRAKANSYEVNNKSD